MNRPVEEIVMVSRSITIKSIDDKSIYVEYQGIRNSILICKIDIDSNKIEILNTNKNPINELVTDIILLVGNLLKEVQ